MSYFNILRNRHNKLIGFNVDGFTIRSWDELQKLAESRIAKHDPSWEEIEINGDDLRVEAERIQQDLLLTKDRQQERITTLEQQANGLLDTTIRQSGEMVALRNKARQRISEMKADVKQEIKAVTMILASIKDSQSSHWQKKENIRLCLEILDKIPTFDRGEFFNYEDDF